MKTLSKDQSQKVNGGFYTITINASVPDSLHSWVQEVVNDIKSGEISNINVMAMVLRVARGAGIDVTAIKIDDIVYSDFNSPTQ